MNQRKRRKEFRNKQQKDNICAVTEFHMNKLDNKKVL